MLAKDWNAIKDASGLQDDAQAAVQDAIMVYQKAILLPEHTNRSIALFKQVERQAIKLRKLWSQLIELAPARAYLFRGDMTPSSENFKAALQNITDTLSLLSEWLQNAQATRAPRARAGSEQSKSMAMFVALLANVYENSTGKAVSTSRKEHRSFRHFIETVCGIVDSGITDNQIRRAVERVVAGRRKNGKLLNH